jgi:hypothetical protein
VPADAVNVAPTTAVPEMDGAWLDTGAVDCTAGGDGDEVVVVTAVVVVVLVVVVVAAVVVVPTVVVVGSVVVQPGIPVCLHGGRLLRAIAAPDPAPASVTITRAMAAAPLVLLPMES